MSRRLRPFALLGLCALLLIVLAHGAHAEDPLTPEQVRERSLPLRTALHHDPTLGSPLERLLELYRKADRVEELLALYRTHLQQYPQDGSARIVHVRLLLATSDPEAPRAVRDAVTQHPDNGYLQFLLYTQLDDRGDPRALDALDRAIEREKLPARKRRWVDMLLAQALKEDRRELASKHVATLADLLGGTAEARIKAARKMDAFGYHEQALAELDKARSSSPSPENGVEIELLAAKLEVALGRREKAASRLDTLLSRLTADYWRRGDILRRRARLVASSDERDAMLKAARERVTKQPQDESAALDCARLLAGFERHRESLEILHAAGTRLPASARIEQEILATYDRLRDEQGRLDYLDERIERQPERQDLVERRIRTLFLIGRKGKALEDLDRVLTPLDEPVRIQRLLESARFLRGVGLHQTAADLYERVVALAPGRLDVRREWAEAHLADGDRRGARRVLAASIPTDAPRDVFLDLMQLLTSQLLYPEARKALKERIEAHPDDLDVLLALVDVEGSMGYASSGAAWIAKARAHADTPARYRRWLEQSAGFHVYYDGEVAFLDKEQERLEADTGEWNDRRLGRVEAFAEISAEHDRIDPVAGLLQHWLGMELPADARVSLRRKLAAMLEESGRGWFTRNEAHLGAAADELRGLIRDDPEFSDTYRARLALIHISRKRPDLARPLLEKIQVRRLNQPRMLERLVRAFTDLDDGLQVLACLERLTVIAASERDHWEDWLAALTASGDERKLRSAVRRLLRGVPRMPLSQESKDELEQHLGDSYWRSIGAELAIGNEAGRLEALALLDEAERIHASEDMPLWVTWTRAWIHDQLSRDEARDEALGELDRMLAARTARELAAFDAELAALTEDERRSRSDDEIAEERKELASSLRRIAFPDGLTASWDAARKLLSGQAPKKATSTTLADRKGPEGRLRARWTFETDGNVAVVAVLPLDEKTLLIADAAGDLHGVDRVSGKLLWHRPQAYAARNSAIPGQYAHLNPVRVPIAGPDGTFFLPMPGHVVCRGPDGARRWEATVGSTGGQTTPVALASDAYGVYVHDTRTGEVACFRHKDGKLRWHKTLDIKPQSTPIAQGEGLSLSDGRLLVYGPRTAILDAKTGLVLWSFEPDLARTMPLTLSEPEDEVRGMFGRRRRRGASARRLAQGSPTVSGPTPSMPPPTFQPWMSSGRMLSSGRFPPGFRGSPGWAPPPPVYITPQGRSPQAWSPKAHPSSTTRVVAPAVHWSSPITNGESRVGVLVGGRMLLARNRPQAPNQPTSGQALLLDTELPMFARSERIDGTPVALYGARLALLQRGTLVVWHLEQGTRSTFDLEEIADGRVLYRVDAVQDGGFLYLAGPGGVLCLHLSTLTEVFRAAWPEAAKPTRSDDPTHIQHMLRGIVEARPGSGWGPMVPPVGYCDGKTLFTLSDAWRVVALEDDADGR